jgi:hypothetical protein
MKVFVITNSRGAIVGTVFSGANQHAPSPGRPSPLRGQRVHEAELPPELEGNTSVDVLHRALAKLIQKSRRPSAAKGKTRTSAAKSRRAKS